MPRRVITGFLLSPAIDGWVCSVSLPHGCILPWGVSHCVTRSGRGEESFRRRILVMVSALYLQGRTRGFPVNIHFQGGGKRNHGRDGAGCATGCGIEASNAGYVFLQQK